ncbi:MAG: hypothetical protein WCG36_09880 [bacterium]
MRGHYEEVMNLVDWNSKCQQYNFRGYGDKDASVWFVGLEFRGGGSEEDMSWCCAGERVYELLPSTIEEERQGKRSATGSKERGTRIYDYMAFMMQALRDGKCSQEKLDLAHLLQPGDMSLFTNAYMLPRPSFGADLTPHMQKLGFSSIAQYMATVETYRFEMLRRYWKERKRAFAVCFGKSAWPAFKKLFELEHLEWDPIVDTNSCAEIQYYKEAGVILVPFFGRWGKGRGPLPFSVISAVVERMRQDWPKDIPMPQPIR